MVTLIPGKPVTVDTPELLVENQLPEGSYRFQMVAIDDAGNESGPAEIVVTVRAPVRPPIFTTINPAVLSTVTTVKPTVVATPVTPKIVKLGKIIDPIRRP
jgi:hypothetical protein